MTTTINKEQKNPNVPNLRFPEFEGEWKRHSLTDFMSFKNGMNPDAKRFGTGTKFISVMDILNNQYICYDNIRASVELQDGDIEAYGVNYGDILFQRSSETLEDIGRANVYLDSKPAIFGGFVIRGKSKDNYNPLFFRYLLASPTARKRIIVKGAGAQHFNIGQDGLSKVFIDIPTLKEQKKIGKLLQCLDERIATQNKIIDKLQSLIKGINQEVFNGVGYSYKLGSICEIKSGYSGNQLIKKEGLKVSRIETISGHRINLERVGYVSPFKNSESYKLQVGDILFSNINSVEYIGNTAFVDKDYDLYHGMNLLRLIPNSKIVVPFYLYLLLNTRKMLNRFKTICNKAVSQASINQADLGKTIIVLPSLENQIKICTIYEVLFSKIEAEKKCLSLYNVQKQYLLRQMFI
ncbi:restriction endonuclease subunit S [Prevotella jejuni]